MTYLDFVNFVFPPGKAWQIMAAWQPFCVRRTLLQRPTWRPKSAPAGTSGRPCSTGTGYCLVSFFSVLHGSLRCQGVMGG